MIDVNVASFSTLFINFVVAMAVGVSLGVERAVNIKETRRMAGTRDFVLVAALSFIASLYYNTAPMAWMIAFTATIGFALCSFVIRSVQGDADKPVGLTTLLSLPITFLLASMPNFGAPFWIIATIVFVILLVLGLKMRIYQFIDTIEKNEIMDFAVLIGIAISITPLIPHEARLPIPLVDMNAEGISIIYRYVMLGTLWKVVVMVSIMSFVAHFVTKYLKGRNALIIATFLGGLVSSLATMLMLLRNNDATTDSKKQEPLSRHQLFLAYVSANTGSILKNIFVLHIAVGSVAFSRFAFMMISTLVLFVAIGVYSFTAQEGNNETVRLTQRALPLKFIFKFSGMLTVLIIIMTMVTYYLGNDALVPAAFLSAIASSTASIASIGTSLTADGGGVSAWTAGVGIIAALMGTICAKYFVIARKIGFKDSLPFILPIFALGCVGMATLWLSLTSTY